MNHLSAEKVASSTPFRFLVGAKQREFTIHSALVAYQSPALDTLQYIYTGKYKAADLDIDPESKSHEPQEIPSAPIQPVFGLPHEKPKDKVATQEQTKSEAQWNEFTPARPAPPKFGDIFGYHRSNYAHKNYTNVFLSHSRLYVFAEYYGIVDLMEISLNQLHRTLIKFKLYEERINDIVALIGYYYENLVPETLREFVILYASYKMEKLWMSEKFRALVEAHGELSGALIGLMLNRLD
ncbi:hypothetical protein PT974_04655 [Cladobotryum mycophilum]|uniref:BTB domain-containing protein n=1 Tax=Cladobotryum mycophilum TaxID=491253 RepID=A0ABR0SVR6_9HYPO